MDGLQRRNPRACSHSSSLKPPRPPGGPSFHPRPAARPLPNPSPPGGRPRKKVRFASEAGGHQTFARHDANTGRAERTRPQNCDAKTTEFKFFKKLLEQSGCTSRSFPKQKEESHNVTPLRKLPDLKRTLCSDETFATPSKNEEISDDRVNVQASNSAPAHDNNDASHLNQHDYLPSIQILTPTIQTSFEAAGISRNTEYGSGHIFLEKRRNLLKIAAKTMSMETSELLQRRSELFADILQRLGAANIIKKHHKESMRQRKMACRHPPADPRNHFENMLDYRLIDFDSSTKLRRGKEPSSYASNKEHQFMALPWECNQGLSRRGNDVRECMALPWVYTANDSSFDWKIGTAHYQVPDLVLEDVQPHSKGKPSSANEFSCNAEFGPYDYHERETMLPVTLAGSISNRLPFPCQVEEQHVVPYAVSNTFWQPDLQNSLVQCTSSSVGLEGQHKEGAGLFHDSDAVLLSRFDQLRACAGSRFLDLSDGILDHNDYSYISNFISESNNIVSNTNRNCLSSISSTSELPFELGSKSLYDSAVRISSLAALDEKYLTEVELIDSSDIGPIPEMDQLSVKFTSSSLSNYTSRILDHPDLRYMSECPPKDSSSILTMDSDDSRLASLPSFSALPGEQDWKNLCDSSIELWSSVHHLRSHGGSLEAKLGFDFEDNHSAMLVEEDPNNLLGTSVRRPCSLLLT